jgi:hypothetical protein
MHNRTHQDFKGYTQNGVPIDFGHLSYFIENCYFIDEGCFDEQMLLNGLGKRY